MRAARSTRPRNASSFSPGSRGLLSTWKVYHDFVDALQTLWQSLRLMAKEGETTAATECEELRHEVAELKEVIRVLIDSIDEVRDELQWLARNGLPTGESLPMSPVLKQMAADPCADDWGERLVIERGNTDAPVEHQTEPTKSTPEMPELPKPGKLF